MTLLLSSCGENVRSWPKSCWKQDQSQYVLIFVEENLEVKVDGISYKKGIIEDHFKKLIETCNYVDILISMPKGDEQMNLHLLVELLDEANGNLDKDDLVTVVNRK